MTKVTRNKDTKSDVTEDNPFMVKDFKKTDDADTRRDMKTSDEIKILRVGDAKVVDFKESEEQKFIPYDKDTEIIELDADNIKRFDITKAKTVKVDGKSIRDDLVEIKKADFRSLQSSKFDEKKLEADIERNIDEYKPLCLTCRGTIKCQTCDGKGKKSLFFKCKECEGSGMCTKCEERAEIECRNCLTKLSYYSTYCRQCGLAFSCPNCYAPIPVAATRCLNCRTEFTCQKCNNIMVPALDEKCRRCGTKEWFKKPVREQKPIRNAEKQ